MFYKKDKSKASCDDVQIVIKRGEKGDQGPIGAPGRSGLPGEQGSSVSNVQVSDGVTPINGVLYPLNTMVTLLSNGQSIISESQINPLSPLQWVDITTEGDWTDDTSGTDSAQYAIRDNIVYMRGRVFNPTVGTLLTGTTVFTLPFNLRGFLFETLALRAGSDETQRVIVLTSGAVIITGGGSQNRYSLDSIPPFYIGL